MTIGASGAGAARTMVAADAAARRAVKNCMFSVCVCVERRCICIYEGRYRSK